MDTESRIREALRLRAEQAPPAGHVLAALHRPKRSRKPLFLAITAATAAAAVAVVATAVGRPSADAPVGGRNTITTTVPATTTSAAAKADTGKHLSLGYSPTWLPEGFVERSRLIDPAERTQRDWNLRTASGQSTTPMLSLVVEHAEQPKRELRDRIANAPAGDRVTVDGAPGVITDPAQDTTLPDAEVVLNPAPDEYVVLTLLNAPDVRATALRIAESLRPDAKPVPLPLSIGGSSVYLANGDGEGRWGVRATGEVDGVGYSASLANFAPSPVKGDQGAEPVAVTARGLPAEYLPTGNGYLTIRLAPDRYLMVAGNGPDTRSAEALIAAAEAIEVDADPDMAWAAP